MSITRLLVSAAFVLASASAGAQVVSFDSIPSSQTIYTSATVDGFVFTSGHFHLFGDGFFASNGTTHISYESGRGYPITMSLADGATFSLLSLDGAEAVTSSPADRPAAEVIGVRGTRQDGSTVTAELVLDLIHDGGSAGSANDFQPFSLPGQFSNLTSVYFYGIRSDGRDGGIALDNLVVTLATPTDTTPPEVFITRPLAGAVVGTVLVEATATDAVGVVGVQFKLDGANLGAEDTVAPYSISWDTRGVSDGPHTVTAEGRDAAGNVGTFSIQVNVSNGVVTGTPYYLDLNGVNQYLEVSDSDRLSFGNGSSDTPLTFELWIRPDTMSAKQNLLSR